MFTSILLTVGGISALCGAGTAVNMLLTWFNTYEKDFSPEGQKGQHHRGGANRANKERVSNLSGRVSPFE